MTEREQLLAEFAEVERDLLAKVARLMGARSEGGAFVLGGSAIMAFSSVGELVADTRWLELAYTDFERGFLALEKALKEAAKESK